jgi:GAF domain-containing protein
MEGATFRPGRGSLVSRVLLERAAVHIPDALADPEFTLLDAQRLGGFRSMLGVPMLREGNLIGVIAMWTTEVRPYTGKQIELVSTFADQAVIAIENVRLFNETKESLERQTATAEILKVIASSPSDVQPVLEAVASSAAKLCEAKDIIVLLREGDALRYRVHHGDIGTAVPIGEKKGIARDWSAGRCAAEGRQIHIHDILAAPSEFPDGARLGKEAGYRTVLMTPLLRDGDVLGVIGMRRNEVRPFEPRQIDLINTFANQAVIAIENVRLFNETKEALERQTATAEILKVIASSPTNVQPVFDVIVERAVRLCGARFGRVYRYDGSVIEMVASHGLNIAGLGQVQRVFPRPAVDDTTAGRAILTRRPYFIKDIAREDTVPALSRQMMEAIGTRSQVTIPMLRAGAPIGVLTMGWDAPAAFNDSQVALLQTFADQAVIAIENVRLFNETKEALDQQTATAEILKVISESPNDTQPVFEAIVRSGLRLFPGATVAVSVPESARVRVAAVACEDPARAAAWQARFPVRLARDRLHGAAILDGTLVDIADVAAEVDGPFATGAKNFLESGNRAVTIMPMMCGDAAIGAVSVVRLTAGPLSEKQLALLRTFAAQAVIAIENVRVFKELEARTGALTRSVEQLTALGEVGQAISSTLDLETVLKTIVQRAVQLTGLDGGAIYEYDERSEEFHVRATENLSEELVQMLRETPAHKSKGVIGRAVETGEPTEIPEMLDDSYQSPRRDSLIKAGYRALLVVPLRRDEHIIGALTVNRKAPGMFSHDVITLLKTFATQSALAIQNARLFREIAEKGKQLEVASRHKSDFLASMSHELRTPLNAILGFNEMILGQIYGDVPADMKEPLEDIQKSGKHLLRLINNVLDLAKIEAGRMELSLQDYSVQDTVESVRATLRPLAVEKGLEFVVTVPQELPLAFGDSGRITQCLMNLAGNSLKFTKAGRVEISVAENDGLLCFRVADTGIGIPREKIPLLFTEFKQTDATVASEYGGTGLGLSISKKFVEMHGGRIWIESELGKGSAFIFEIPLRVNS